MSAAQLLDYFHQVADAPDAIAHWRRYVLALAVRGKLVSQDARDMPVPAVLDARGVPWIRDGEFPIPASWAWVATGSVAAARLGKMLDKAKNKGTPQRYLRNTNVRWFDLDLSDLKSMRMEAAELEEFALRAGDVLICEGGEPGRAAVWDAREEDVYFQKAIHRVRLTDVVAGEYFVRAMRASADEGRLTAYCTGTGIQHLTGKGLASVLIPLPPIAEQRRIVQRIHELMALCDRIESEERERGQVRYRFARATLSRLADRGASVATLADGTAFALSQLDEITGQPGTVRDLRATILDLAVLGRLLPQDAVGEPAVMSSERHVGDAPPSRRQGGRRQRADDSTSSNAPFALPTGWEWISLGELCSKTGSGSTPRGGKQVYKSSGVIFLRSQNIYDDGIRLGDVAYIDEATHAKMQGTRVQHSDLLLNITGGSLGRCAIVPADLPEANVSQHVAIVRPALQETAPFLHVVARSPYFQDAIRAAQTGAGRGGLPKNRMDRIAVALPSLPEQRRIVARVEQLLALCDQLDRALLNRAAHQAKILASLLSDVVGTNAGK